MTAPTTETFRSRWYLPWIMLALGLVIGYIVGRYTYSLAQAKVGNCVSSDTTEVVATGVSFGECRDICPTCSWTQPR
jgi:hypothetical protein